MKSQEFQNFLKVEKDQHYVCKRSAPRSRYGSSLTQRSSQMSKKNLDQVKSLADTKDQGIG